MKYTVSQITKIHITDLDGHDSIHVYLEDYNLGQGKITITCCDDSWTNYWGAMGNRNIAHFFSTCSIDYLIRKLSRVSMTIYDEDQLKTTLKRELVRMRREGEFSEVEARDLWNSIEWMDPTYELLPVESDVLCKLIGDDWHCSLPQKPNPDYTYLYVIIKVIQEALKEIYKESK
jgi:hypothetical protein